MSIASEPLSRPAPFERSSTAAPPSARSFDRRVLPAVHGELAAVSYCHATGSLVAVVALRTSSRVPAGLVGRVRFLVSRDGGERFVDAGTRTFALPRAAHLETARVVALPFAYEPGPATHERANLLWVRAILTLDGTTPPTRAPGLRRGQFLDAEVLLTPRAPSVEELLALAGIPLAPGLLETFGVVGVRKTDPVVPPVVELVCRYAASGAWHRALLSTMELARAARQPRIVASVLARAPKELGIDYAAAVRKLDDATDRCAFEELAALGLDETEGALVAVVRTKKRVGYLGALGEEGGLEHVAFWLDRGDGVLRYEGTASARVHDGSELGDGGRTCAVTLPVADGARRGPGRMRVRAVLSFRELPSASDPHAMPRFGHQREAVL